MTATQKAIEIANHRHAWKGYVGIAVTSLATYFGAPVIQDKADSMAIAVDGIEVRQEKYISQNKKIILNQEIDLALKYPKAKLDSVKKEILFEKFWHENN